MTFFVKAVPAQQPRTKESSQIALLYAVILVIFAVGQLFTFDKFIELVPSFQLPLGEVLQFAVAPLLVMAEVLALPFLLRMTLSPAFRWLSMVCGWLVAGLWTGISTWVVITRPAVDTIGYLGTIGELTPGWWALFVPIALAILAVWSSWGLWPGKRSKNS